MDNEITYEIKIGESVGHIHLGATRKDVQHLFDDLEELIETPYGYDREVITDINDDFMIYYDENNNVALILCTTPQKLSFRGASIRDYSLWELYSIIHSFTADIQVDNDGFVSNALGFGVSIETQYTDDGISYDVIESVQIATKNFWKNEPVSLADKF